MAAIDELAYYRSLGLAVLDLDSARSLYFKALIAGTIAPGQLGGYTSGNYYAAVNMTSLATSTFTANQLRLVPFVITKSVTLASLALETTVVGDAGSVARLGIYGADSNGQPTTLVAEAGTVPTDAVGCPEVAFASPPTLAPGVYWGAVVVQGAVTTQPTLRTTNINNPVVPVGSPTALTAGAVKTTYSGATVATGSALPASPGTLSGSSLLPRLIFKVA